MNIRERRRRALLGPDASFGWHNERSNRALLLGYPGRLEDDQRVLNGVTRSIVFTADNGAWVSCRLLVFSGN